MQHFVYFFAGFEIALGVFTACGAQDAHTRARYLPLAKIEASYGALITAGNHPTPDQHGTGERVGLFQDTNGTVWGLPLMIRSDHSVLACAPPGLHSARVTGTFPAGSTIIGTANQPTGWRGGTGEMELLLHDRSGAIRWLAVDSAPIKDGRSCWAADLPGPPQQLHYYRLIPR
jgi:hypothetical protein